MPDRDTRTQIATLVGVWLGSVGFLVRIKILDCAPDYLHWQHIAAAVWMPMVWILCFGVVVLAVAFVQVLLEERRR